MYSTPSASVYAELEVGGRPGLLHVVAGDRDRVELRHLLRREGEDVGDDPHRRARRVDVGVADHELLEHVVLDRARELRRLHALLLGGEDVEREHREHGAVHRHRHAHLVERDVVEQLAHVEDRVDGHAGHADVARHTRVVAVVAAVGRQVERHRQALLAGGEVAAVEGVGLLGRGEAGVLADRPRLVDVHRRVRPAQERDEAGLRVEEVEAVEVGGGVDRAARRCPRASPTARRHGVVPSPVAGRRGRRRRASGTRREVGDRSWDLQEVEELGRAWRGRRCRRGSCARCRPAACRRGTPPRPGRLELRRRPRRRARRRRRRWSRGRRSLDAGGGEAPSTGPRVHGQAGDLEEVLGERRPRRERGRRADRGEEHRRARVADRSTRPRSASNPSAQRCGASGPPSVCGHAGGGGSATFGNSVSPVSGARRVSMSRWRAAAVEAMRSATKPSSTARRKPPRLLDLLEPRPRRLGELVGEPLDVPRPAGRVGDLGEVRLGEQDRLRVAGDAAAELGRLAQAVVGEHGDGVGAGDAGGEAGDGRAQRVHPRVVAGHHRPRRHGVDRWCRRTRPRPRRRGPTAGEGRGSWRSWRTGRRWRRGAARSVPARRRGRRRARRGRGGTRRGRRRRSRAAGRRRRRRRGSGCRRR